MPRRSRVEKEGSHNIINHDAAGEKCKDFGRIDDGYKQSEIARYLGLSSASIHVLREEVGNNFVSVT